MVDPISMAVPMLLPAVTGITIHNVTTRTLRKLDDWFGNPFGDKGGRGRRRRRRRRKKKLPPRDKKGRFRKRRRRRKKR